MSDHQGAPEAQQQQEQQGIQVAPQFMINALQQKVAQQANDITVLEALANQQQEVIQNLAQQVVDLEAELEHVRPSPVPDQPKPEGRVTKKAPAKKAAPA